MTPIEDCLSDGGPPLLWLSEFAADLEGEDYRTMRSDAGVLSRSLETAAELFQLPAVSSLFDTTLESQALGCSLTSGDDTPRVKGCVRTVDDAFDVDTDEVTTRGEMPVVLDATERLVSNLAETSVLGGITGPGQLTDNLLAREDAGENLIDEVAFVADGVLTELVNTYLELGVDGIAVLEPDGIRDSDWYLDALTPALNIIDHYESTAVLVQRTVTDEDVELASSLGFDAVTGRVDDPKRTYLTSMELPITLGIGIPDSRFSNGDVDEFLAELPADALVSSGWTVPTDTTPETVHRIMGSL